jgi:hypothetical protein
MSNIPGTKRQKLTMDTTFVPNAVQQAMNSLGSAFDVIANHQPSSSFTPITNSCLRRYIVGIESGYEAYGWEPKLIKVKPYQTIYSNNPSLHMFFSMISPQHIIRFMDNLYAFDQDKYDLFKRLLTGAPQGKAGQESDVTVWNTWVELQIRHLPHFSVASYFFLLDDSKQEILMSHQSSQVSPKDGILTTEDCSMFNEFFYEDWYKNKLCNVYPKGSTAIQDFINNNSDERFSRMLNIFDAFDSQFNECFKNILKNDALPENIQYYEHMVCSFSSLPGIHQENLKDQHLVLLLTYQPIENTQFTPGDYQLLNNFKHPNWHMPYLAVRRVFPVVKSGVMHLVNSLSKENFQRILDIFYSIDRLRLETHPSLYESFKKIITNQDWMDDHMIYDQALREFPTRP